MQIVDIAAKPCGCKVTASGTYQADGDVDAPLVRFRITGKATGPGGQGSGTASVTNLSTGEKYTVTFDQITCGTDSVSMTNSITGAATSLENNVVPANDIDRVFIFNPDAQTTSYTFTIANENLVRITSFAPCQ